ncbi:hypothetical protein [Dactylosporangium sp. NPDC005555]|uniref:hypothetical protein n=1 Tax=Dactylosporangium sp. NPDC005555 TaxID=3154889 RepID=UPI0033A86F4E
MSVVAPSSRLRRGVRRLTLALCALILGAGFTPALPLSIVDRPAPAVATAAQAAVVAPARPSVVRLPAAIRTAPEFPQAVGGAVGTMGAVAVVLEGATVGAAAGRAPPRILA